MTTSITLDTKAVAEALSITPKELRVFLRAAGEGMSSRDGKSYVFTKANLAAITKAYPAWVKKRATARVARAEAAVADDTAQAS